MENSHTTEFAPCSASDIEAAMWELAQELSVQEVIVYDEDIVMDSASVIQQILNRKVHALV